MVNGLIVGTQDKVVKASTTAGWVQVDNIVKSTALNAALESVEKKDY
jgi:hypothetical protein